MKILFNNSIYISVLLIVLSLFISSRLNALPPPGATLDSIKGGWSLKSFKESDPRKKTLGELKLKTTARLTIEDSGRFFLSIVIQGKRSTYTGYLRSISDNNIAVVGVDGPLHDSPPKAQPANSWKMEVSETTIAIRLPSGSEYVFERDAMRR